MQAFLNFLSSHQLVLEAGVLWVVSAAISTMPEPSQQDSVAYNWLYGFLHVIAANLNRFGARLPGGTVTVSSSTTITKTPEETK